MSMTIPDINDTVNGFGLLNPIISYVQSRECLAKYDFISSKNCDVAQPYEHILVA